MPSPSRGLYLKAILVLEERDVVPLRARLVERMGVSASAVAQRIDRLEREGLVTLGTDKVISLSDEGRDIARCALRRHRLAERFLFDVLGVNWASLHLDADRWEPAMSEDAEDGLATLLDDPRVCPHGNPIPSETQIIAPSSRTTLASAALGPFTVVRVDEDLVFDRTALGILTTHGLLPGATGLLTDRTLRSLALGTGASSVSVPIAVARRVFVRQHHL